MKDNTYLESGIIEAYCLGSLNSDQAAEVADLAAKDPKNQAEIEATLSALETYLPKHEPRKALKTNVLNFLDKHFAAEKIDVFNPPFIHLHSDRSAWQSALKETEPSVIEPSFKMHVLKESDDFTLSVVWLSGEMIEDEHSDSEFQESFFILEGACECNFEGTIVRFGAGDYFDIPPNTKHSIRNISDGMPFVKGLVQRHRAA